MFNDRDLYRFEAIHVVVQSDAIVVRDYHACLDQGMRSLLPNMGFRELTAPSRLIRESID